MDNVIWGFSSARRQSRQVTLMQIAEVVSRRSTCNRLHVGAVIAKDFRVISTGYNGPPAGLPHCSHEEDEADGCTASVHAEMNAILAAARHGVGVEGSALYVTHMPCLACAQAIVNSGLSEVFYDQAYRKTEGVQLMEHAGVKVGRIRT